MVEEYLTKRVKLPPTEVKALIVEYRRYLVLCAVNPSTRKPISPQVDQVWHAHILFTKDYRAMSEAVFGRYLDHRPAQNDEDIQSLAPLYFAHTLPEYQEIFGEPNVQFWPINNCVCKECCNDE